MHKVRIVAAFATLIMILSSTFAIAQEPNRKGFIIGFAAGGGYQAYEAEVTGGAEKDRSHLFAFATNFRIGTGINEQLMIYYDTRTSWFGISEEWTDESTAGIGVMGLGFSYFLEPRSPSVYLLGSIGISYMLWLGRLDEWVGDGFGFSAGVGYEFRQHWAIEGTVLWGMPDHDVDGVKINSLAFLVTIGGTWY